MKVRLSQIPEDSGKPKFTRKHAAKPKKGLIGDIDEDEEEEEAEGQDDDWDNGEEDKKRLSKTVLHFKEFGVTISAYDFHTMEYDMRFVEKPKAHWEFGITINKDLTPGQFITKTNISFWFMTEEARDEKMEKLLEVLKENGLNVIEV